MDRHILHIDQDCFFVEVARLYDSSLKGKPVLVGGTAGRGVVASCSYEARKFGVHSAMPMRMALQQCPDATVVRCDFDLISKHSKQITDIIADSVPLYEKMSVDEHYIDLTGMDKFFGCVKYAHELRERIIKESGLPVSFGLSLNKTVSKVATGLAKPNGERNVSIGEERSFLAPLPVNKIPGLGSVKSRQLRKMGVDRIGQLQAMPAELIEKVIDGGATIWKKANGIDDSLVVPYHEQKSMSREQTFQQDTTDIEFLRKTIMGMVSELGFDLRTEGKIACTVAVKVRYSDFQTYEKQVKISHTNLDKSLIQAALDTFEKLYTRRVLVRLIGVKLTGLMYGSPQIDLFNSATEQIELNQAMDSIKKRFGASFLKLAAVL